MKQHVLLYAAALAMAAGCEKSSDLAPVAAEANGIAKSYEARVTELQQRADDLERRRRALQPGAESAQAATLIAEVSRDLLPRMQTAVREAPVRIERTAQEDKLVELRAYAHQIRSELGHNWTQANAQLDAVEAWVFREEHRPRAQAPTPAQPVTPPPPPMPAPADQAPAGGTAPPIQ